MRTSTRPLLSLVVLLTIVQLIRSFECPLTFITRASHSPIANQNDLTQFIQQKKPILLVFQTEAAINQGSQGIIDLFAQASANIWNPVEALRTLLPSLIQPLNIKSSQQVSSLNLNKESLEQLLKQNAIETKTVTLSSFLETVSSYSDRDLIIKTQAPVLGPRLLSETAGPIVEKKRSTDILGSENSPPGSSSSNSTAVGNHHEDDDEDHDDDQSDEDEQMLLQVPSNKSKMFLMMTPLILSGLIVSLFLIIMILIGVSCVSNIKTNDRFARNNLWVGKQS